VPPPFARRFAIVSVVMLALAGCASTAVDQNYDAAQGAVRQHLGTDVQWLRTPEARREAQAAVDALLEKPLGADDAVRIALAYSPSVQAVLYENAASSAAATQSARLPNPVFAFERLLRNQSGLRELEITRFITFSLYDLILMPSRARLADYQQQQLRLRLSGDVVRAAIDARQAWVRAVAAEQVLQYAQQVRTAADASAELARRMQAVGNFSRLQRAREQAFSAESVAELARAQHRARGAREALVRALGLSETQARALALPSRLPDLPSPARDEAHARSVAMNGRLDVRLANARLEYALEDAGVTDVASVLSSLEAGVVCKSETGLARQSGYAFEVPIPIFDWGDAARLRAQSTLDALMARTQQLRVDARSQFDEAYDAYRTAYDLARHYRDEIVPLRRTISEENLLRYNGMLIGVFDLLADARERIASVMQSIEAQRDFWLADATLQAALIGAPSATTGTFASDADSRGDPAR
jgi:outer membrane protein TolC